MKNFIAWGTSNESAIQELETKLKFKLPADYRKFLLTTNGGVINDELFRVADLNEDILFDIFFAVKISDEDLTIESWMAEHGDEIQKYAVIIGADQGGGLILYITAGKNAGVYYWDHSHFFSMSSSKHGNTYFLAESFDEFCKMLRPFAK